MSQEIIYTSAPQGLKAGSRGFCTVVSTSGMAKNLVERLESLSGYRHAYLGEDARVSLNPVNFSHLILTVGGQQFHVLSRIGDAGVDYSKRSNKLAHHVVLVPKELVPGGPAWVLADPSFCETQFDGKPRIIASGRKPRSDPFARRICREWEEVTGDAGWAGVLAANGAAKNAPPMSILFKPGSDMLPLVVEALGLLDPDQRWKVSFSTYFTKLPAGVACQWRFVLDGTQEANALRRNPHVPVIDLCKPLGAAPDGDFVEFARSGNPSERASTVPDRAVRTTITRPRAPIDQTGHGPPGHRPSVEDVGVYTMDDPGAPPGSLARGSRNRFGRRGQIPPWAYALGGAALMLLVVFMIFAAYLLLTGGHSTPTVTPNDTKQARADGRPPSDRMPQPTDDRTERSRPKQPERSTETREAPTPKKRARPEPPPPDDDAPDSSKPADSGKPEAKKPNPATKPKRKPREDGHRPLDDVRAKKNLLELPNVGGAISGVDYVELANLYLPDPAECELGLIGTQAVVGDAVALHRKKMGGAVVWEARKEKGDGALTQGAARAYFKLDKGSLFFKWPSQTYLGALRYCRLRIRCTDDEELVRLSKPIEMEPWSINLTRDKVTFDKLSGLDIPAENLFLDIEFVGVKGKDARAPLRLRHGELTSIILFEPGARESDDHRMFELDMQFFKGKDCALALKTLAYTKFASVNGNHVDHFKAPSAPPPPAKGHDPVRAKKVIDAIARKERSTDPFRIEIAKLANRISVSKRNRDNVEHDLERNDRLIKKTEKMKEGPVADLAEAQKKVNEARDLARSRSAAPKQVRNEVKKMEQQTGIGEIQEHIKSLDNELSKLRQESNKMKTELRILEQVHEWNVAVDQYRRDLTEHGTFRFRVYVKAEDDEFDLLTTKESK